MVPTSPSKKKKNTLSRIKHLCFDQCNGNLMNLLQVVLVLVADALTTLPRAGDFACGEVELQHSTTQHKYWWLAKEFLIDW